MFKWIYEKIKIFKEREIRIFGLPVIQYGSRILPDGTNEKFFRLFHKSLEHQFLDYILSFVPNEHDYIFLVRCNGLGENYLLNFMLDEMIKKKGIKNPCFVSHREVYRDLFAMWNDIPFYKDPFIRLSYWNAVLLHPIYHYKGKTFHVYHTTVNESKNFLALNFSANSTAHYLEHVRKQSGCTIQYRPPKISDDIILSINEKTKHVSIASLNPQIADLTITVNGFSKAYAMTGWRLGYLTAPLWLTQRIAALQSHATSNATSFVQYAALSALHGEADNDVAKMVTAFAKRRQLICELLAEIPYIKFYAPQGAFYVLCDISQTGLSADEFAKQILAKENLAVIPCTAFGAPKAIRLSYACSEDNIKEACLRLNQFIAKL